MAEVLKYMAKKVVADLSTVIVAPMPGMVKSVGVQVGDQVSRFRLGYLSNGFTVSWQCCHAFK